MGADALAEIRPALRELADAAESGGASGAPCVTFSIPGRPEEFWVQVLAGTVNFAYPHADAPERLLGDLLGESAGNFKLEGWTPDRYATFRFDNVSLNELARVVDRIFSNVQNAPADDGLDVEFSLVAGS